MDCDVFIRAGTMRRLFYTLRDAFQVEDMTVFAVKELDDTHNIASFGLKKIFVSIDEAGKFQ